MHFIAFKTSLAPLVAKLSKTYEILTFILLHLSKVHTSPYHLVPSMRSLCFSLERSVFSYTKIGSFFFKYFIYLF